MQAAKHLPDVGDLMAELAYLDKYETCTDYAPYAKQREFHAAGLTHPERLLGAGNQTGKTYSGAHEAAFHATGLYPDDWEGQRFDKANVGWVCGVSGEVIRDTTQKLLVGRMQDPDSIGTGAIPKRCIKETIRALGVKDLLDHVKVKHVTGETSLIFFKSYEKGRQKFQGETIDWAWCDEEPPPDIYSEVLTRTNNGQNGQFLFMTFTPLLGMTEVAFKYYKDPGPFRHLTLMSIHDVDHYTDAEKAQIVASYPEHEREAREKGLPILGSGLIFPVMQSTIEIEPIPLQPHWPRINGIDFGWDHPQAAVSVAWDRDTDTVYVYNEYRKSETTPEIAALTLRTWGDWIPWAWPHDGYQHDKGSGSELAGQYRSAGLNFLHKHATHAAGGNGVEAGLMEMLDRMQTGRFKVFSTCPLWFEEMALYHRKDGKIVKLRDDVISATRYAVMMLRLAITKPTTVSVDIPTMQTAWG